MGGRNYCHPHAPAFMDQEAVVEPELSVRGTHIVNFRLPFALLSAHFVLSCMDVTDGIFKFKVHNVIHVTAG